MIKELFKDFRYFPGQLDMLNEGVALNPFVHPMNLIDKIFGNCWEVRRTIWPYRDGYGVYNPYTRTVLETGISKEAAQAICDEMNTTSSSSELQPQG